MTEKEIVNSPVRGNSDEAREFGFPVAGQEGWDIVELVSNGVTTVLGFIQEKTTRGYRGIGLVEVQVASRPFGDRPLVLKSFRESGVELNLAELFPQHNNS